MVIRRLTSRRYALAAAWLLAAGSALHASDPPCPVTPVEDRLPGVIAPMAGEDPIRLVPGGSLEWLSAHAPAKSVWVLSRPADGDLSLRGRRPDGEGVLHFRVGDEAAESELLSLRAGDRDSVVPGGAGAEVISRYEFVPTYLVFPSPGCWEITARLGDTERRIVVELVDEDTP